MKKLITIFILILGVTSCSSDDEVKINNSDIVGKWNWFSTDGGIGYHIHENPESTGKEIELNLRQNYSYSIKENGTEISNGTYELSMRDSNYSTEQERFITCSGNYQNQNVVLSGIIRVINIDTLTISDNYDDGIGSGFKKSE
jgi:hypothetical protein